MSHSPDELKKTYISASRGYPLHLVRDLVDLFPGITVANGYQGLVSGGAMFLTAQAGVGNSTVKPLLLDSPGVTDFALDKLTLTANTNVYLQEKTGDLRVNSIVTGGNVWISVPHGSLVDANTNSHVDQRTEAQLLSGVWSALQLTDATGYQQRVQASINSFASDSPRSYAAL